VDEWRTTLCRNEDYQVVGAMIAIAPLVVAEDA
jgi:hypothetical protein